MTWTGSMAGVKLEAPSVTQSLPSWSARTAGVDRLVFPGALQDLLW